MDNFLAVLFAVLPIMAVMGCGFVLFRIGLMTKPGTAELGRLVYWVALPCILFAKLSTGDQLDPPWTGLIIAVIAYGASVILVLLTTRSQEAALRGSLATISYRSNSTFVGLPVAMMLIHNGICDQAFESYFLLFLACTVPLFNVYSVIGFLMPHHGLDKSAMKKVGVGLMKNPLILSCALGIVFSQLGWGKALQDNVIMRSIDLIGQSAIPLALIMAGASIRLETLRSGNVHFWFWNVWKMILLPLIVYFICVLCQVDQNTMMALIIISAAPGAVAAVPMAQELGGDEELSACSVVLTTLISPLSLVGFLLLASYY